ncbi:hypothetical protein LY76DRAFT_637948 [Colletotrichum caudatum]|nr:hypothetical protein LY76DRAFT_637948 [Colletotrichum caudatum]
MSHDLPPPALGCQIAHSIHPGPWLDRPRLGDSEEDLGCVRPPSKSYARLSQQLAVPFAIRNYNGEPNKCAGTKCLPQVEELDIFFAAPNSVKASTAMKQYRIDANPSTINIDDATTPARRLRDVGTSSSRVWKAGKYPGAENKPA